MKSFIKMTTAAVAAGMVVWAGGSVHADEWVGGGADNEFSTAANWGTGVFPENIDPLTVNNNSTQDINGAFTVERSLDTNMLGTAIGEPAVLTDGNSPGRVFLKGGAVLNVTGGTHSDHRSGSNIFNFVGDNGSGTVNQSGGSYNIGHGLRIGAGNNGNVLDGTYNLTGGSLIVSRGANSLLESNLFGRPSIDIGSEIDTVGTPDDSGLFELSGNSSLETRGAVHLNPTGTFSVVGSGHSASATGPKIGIGSNGSLDGAWVQSTAGVLKCGLDAGGVTPILIDDVGDDGAGAQGNVVFRAGAVLDPYDAGSANNAWTTVMSWEGALTDEGLVLSSDAVTAGWEMQIVGSELQVRNPSFPDPVAGLVGDFNGDMLVDCADIDEYIGLIGSAATVRPELDLVVDGTIDLADVAFLVETLVVTQPNGQVGTFLGDLNCDGAVNVLGDAFILVGSLNNAATSYSQGDINLDGQVNVLGDAFALVANLGNSNAQ